MTTAESQEARTSAKTAWWVGGACLWLLAAFGLYSVWHAKSQDTEQQSQAGVSDNGPRTLEIKPDDDGAVSANKDDGKPEPIVLTPTADTGPRWDPEGIDDFELVDQTGRTVTKADLLGKPFVVSFIFTRCTATCPKISFAMWTLQNRLQDADVRFVSITVDPENDTPEQLARYAEGLAADPERWLFLTGDKQEIYKLATESFQVSAGKVAGEPFHTNDVLHVDATGRVIAKYNALDEAEMAKLRRALEGKESAEETSTDSDSQESD